MLAFIGELLLRFTGGTDSTHQEELSDMSHFYSLESIVQQKRKVTCPVQKYTNCTK